MLKSSSSSALSTDAAFVRLNVCWEAVALKSKAT